MAFDSLEAWLHHLALQKIERNAGSALKAIKQVAARLNVLSWDIPVVTVGGTNGKGSCVAVLEAVYKQAGFCSGAFTSPHLLHFNERIRISGKPVDDDLIFESFLAIEKARGSISLNYFQFSFLAALLIFKRVKLDVLVLEVGIGGRYDAVNIIDPWVSVIASVDLDHCDVLGNTREQIGRDKAGIMRKEKPCICGDFNPPATLFEEALRIRADLYCVSRDFSYQEEGKKWSWRFKDSVFDELPFMPNLLTVNAACALMVIHFLQTHLQVSFDAIKEGLLQVEIPGRQQLVQIQGIPVLFDVSHNEAAAKVLAKKVALLKSQIDKRKVYAVVGMMKSKDATNTLRALLPYVDTFFVSDLNDARGASGQNLKRTLLELEKFAKVEICSLPTDSFRKALDKASKEDLIVVFGSFLTVAGVMALNVEVYGHG